MQRLGICLLLAILAAACAPEQPAIPPGERAVCAGGLECRSVRVGSTLVRAEPGVPLFNETVRANEGSFADTSALSETLKRADGELHEDYSRNARMCPVGAGDRVVLAQLSRLVRLKHLGPACKADAMPAYAVVVAPNGHVACIESQFMLTCF
jgi:hypothetical protein